MVPGEIFDHPLARGAAHLFDRFGMIVKITNCVGNGRDVAGLDQNSFDAIAHDVARFLRRD